MQGVQISQKVENHSSRAVIIVKKVNTDTDTHTLAHGALTYLQSLLWDFVLAPLHDVNMRM